MSPLPRLHPVSALCLLLAAFAAEAQPLPKSHAGVEPGAIVVDFKDGTTKAEFDAWEAEWGVDVEFNSAEGARTGITLARGVADVEAALARIRRHPGVEAAEPLAVFTVPKPAEPSVFEGPAPRVRGRGFIPNDPEFGRQWNLVLIDMPSAWERSRGRGVVVAVLDTGIAYEDHGDFRQVPDLKGVRFVEGYDFVNDDVHANDDHGHGTHVAGTVAQATHNGQGVAGVAFEAALMPVKVLNHFGAGNAADIAEAIRFAADHGAHVINLSLGGGTRSEVMARAVAYARGRGVVVVAAAGNRGLGQVEFPAAYEGVVAVAAVGPDGARAPYSSYGKELDLAAPGGNKLLGGEAGGILQNTVDPRAPARSIYASYQGTSMATPHVAGVAALLFAAGARAPEDVERALFEGATRVKGQGWSPEYGHGLLNAERALGALKGWWGVDWKPLGWAVALLALVLLTLGRRERPGYLKVLFHPAFALPLLVATVGLFFVRGFGTHELGRPASPLVYSALVPGLASLFAIRLKGLRPVVGGLALGFAGLLAYAAWSGAPAIAWMPFRLLAVPWLVLNVLVCLFVARALLRVERA